MAAYQNLTSLSLKDWSSLMKEFKFNPSQEICGGKKKRLFLLSMLIIPLKQVSIAATFLLSFDDQEK